nr:ribonuclease H-like domain-containing protein [Tanacetum cinerariifolium]
FQDIEKAAEEGTQTYVLFPVLSDGSTYSPNNNKDALIDGKEHDDDIQKHNFININNDFSAAGPLNDDMPNVEDLTHSNDADDVYRNKKDERGIVIKNKARLVAQGHTQEEGIDYEEVFAPVA